jgi:perosamine synthetase
MQQIEELIVEAHQSIAEALQIIDRNARGICLVTETGKLVGVASDGDIRRGLIRNSNLERPIREVMNCSFTALPVQSSEKQIRQNFSTRLRLIPLLNEVGKVVDVADVQRSHRIPVLEPQLSGNELEYVQDCVSSNWISSQGSYVRQFEEMFEEMHPGTTALAVANGTTALHLALEALGVKEGDEVIIPNVTFAATINAVLYCRATPVLCEIDPVTWCIDVSEAEKLITARTRVILPVHLYGQVCHMDKLCKLAQANQLLTIEDCAEAIGSHWRKQPVGTFGDAAMFSFFGNKTISTGEGGMVLFRNPEVMQRARVLRDHGMMPGKHYWHEVVGFNYRLTNLQAAIGVAQLERFSAILGKKRQIAAAYNENLANVEGIVQLPDENTEVLHSNWLYTVILANHFDRNNILRELLHHGVDTRPVFNPLHQMPPYQGYRTSEKLKHSIRISEQGLSLPSSVSLKEEEIDYVSKMLEQVLKEQA